MRNAALEGCRIGVEIETGDMRALPFPDHTFDARRLESRDPQHQLECRACESGGGGLAGAHAGGRLAIADIRATARYAATLRALGAAGVNRRGLGWRFWCGNPFAGTTPGRRGEAGSISRPFK